MLEPKRTAFNWLHVMWTRDVGREGYNKEEWKKFEEEILALEREAKGIDSKDKIFNEAG